MGVYSDYTKYDTTWKFSSGKSKFYRLYENRTFGVVKSCCESQEIEVASARRCRTIM